MAAGKEAAAAAWETSSAPLVGIAAAADWAGTAVAVLEMAVGEMATATMEEVEMDSGWLVAEGVAESVVAVAS
jgi:hypothetical protein